MRGLQKEFWSQPAALEGHLEFADGKPLELLSGSNLLYLLAQNAGIEAKIEVPEDWKDPSPDSGE